jgi:hypothetical protein
MTAPSIVQVYPSDGAEGVILNDTFYIIFDREIDPTSVKIILEGPDHDTWSGPDLVVFDNPETNDDDDVLESPGLHGVVPGTMVHQRVDASGDLLSGVFDFSGGGTSYRSKILFTPTKILGPTTDYILYVVGDEDTSDIIEAGVSTRTVFDEVKGANIGDGDAFFTGGYNGTINDVYNIEVLETGDASEGLHFNWWKTSRPTVKRKLDTKLQSQLLDQGVNVRFDGDFTTGDTFTVVVRAAERMEGTYSWSFISGSGNITSLPSTVASDPSVPIASVPTTSTTSTDTSFTVSSWVPKLRATNLAPLSITSIVATFSADIDEDTIDADSVSLWTEPVNGDVDYGPEFTGDITVDTFTVSGSSLTISFTNTTVDQSLFANNMIFVELDETVADTDGNALGSDYTYYFTTTYDPLYSSVRRVRLELGQLINDIPDDTINLAIYEASLEADALTFGTLVFDTASASTHFIWARRQYVTCVAELILLGAMTGQGGGSDGKSKRLADLNVSYSGGGPLDDLIDKAIACRNQHEKILTSSGVLGPGTSLQPQMVIKGANDPDRPYIGREWERTSTYGNPNDRVPAANTRSRWTNRRRWKSDYSGVKWGRR